MLRKTHLLIIMLVLLMLVPGSSTSAEQPEPGVHITTSTEHIYIQWRAPANLTASDDADIPGFTTMAAGNVIVPAYMLALLITADTYHVEIEHAAYVPWHGTLPTTHLPTRQTTDGTIYPPLTSTLHTQLSPEPVVILREGTMRGQRLVIAAISPIVERNGTTQLATSIQATISGAQLLTDTTQRSLEERWDETSSFPTPLLSNAPAPVNPLAQRQLIKVHVQQAGIQRISGQMLINAGLSFQPFSPAQIHLWHNGVQMPLEEQGTEDGVFDATDEVHFYAPAPDNRWNEQETYWLTVETTPGQRIAPRASGPAGAPQQTTAYEQGIWQNNTLYESTLAGPDGDHWFAADLRSAPGLDPMTVSIPLTPTLPLAAGTSTITLTGSAATTETNRLAVQMGATTRTITWTGKGDWTHRFIFDTSQPAIQVSLVPEQGPTRVLLDRVVWEQPVSLVSSGQSAEFVGKQGTWQYLIAGTTSDSMLYDISTPETPVRIPVQSNATTISFQDGPAPHRYMLANSQTLHTPEVSLHQPVDLVTPRNAEVVYIAPAAFHQTLAPLRTLRQTQGYTTTLVDVQAIYDAWSYGQVDPNAIRSFLRYAGATWNPAPVAAILVGDGTLDPKNYKQRNNPNLIPPYLAVVDPWLGETACETCYAQLDGDDPLSDALPDMFLGRLPVSTVAELETVITKIIGYETADEPGAWRSQALYIADNYVQATGEFDTAGDFAALADAGVTMNPQGITSHRIYYDPSPTHTQNAWREPDAVHAYQKTVAALNGGVGLVTYIGHSHYWQWAVTDLQTEPPYLFGLDDADGLTNGNKLPVVLEMTCLTGSFHQPAYRGTIDERLVLNPNGGAVAVWGSTGLGVAYGHDALQRGFLSTLWDAPPATSSLGSLMHAGYLELFSTSTCCQESLRTYSLLGDPLTRVRVAPSLSLYLPFVER